MGWVLRTMEALGNPRRRAAGNVGRWAGFAVAFVMLTVGTAAVAGAIFVVDHATTGPPHSNTTNSLKPGAPVLVHPHPPVSVQVGGRGYDISYPQCGRTPPLDGSFAIVGVNGGAPLTTNSCLSAQSDWARTKAAHAVYVNTAYSGVGDPVAYGKRLVDDAVSREHAAGAGSTSMWWLDVETTNVWRGTQRENATVLDSMAARIQQLGARVGVYSTSQQWSEITGDWTPGLPVWKATGSGTASSALAACSEQFAGSQVSIVQWVQRIDGHKLDHDLICPAWIHRAGELLQPGSG